MRNNQIEQEHRNRETWLKLATIAKHDGDAKAERESRVEAAMCTQRINALSPQLKITKAAAGAGCTCFTIGF